MRGARSFGRDGGKGGSGRINIYMTLPYKVNFIDRVLWISKDFAAKTFQKFWARNDCTAQERFSYDGGEWLGNVGGRTEPAKQRLILVARYISAFDKYSRVI